MSELQLMQVYIESWGAVLLSVFAIGLMMINKDEPKSTKALTAVLVDVVLLLMADALAIYFRGNMSIAGFYGVRIFNFIVFVTSVFVPMFSILFFVETLREHSSKDEATSWVLLAQAVTVVSLMLVVISQFTGIYYFFDVTNCYIRGEYYVVSQIGPLLLMLIYIFMVVYYRKYFTLRGRVTLAIYMLIPLSAIVVQTLFYGVSLINIAVALSAIIMFIQRLNTKSAAVRRARMDIAKQHLQEELGEEDSVIEERLKGASIGRGNVKHIFIVNPYAGKHSKIDELRRVLEKFPESDYFVFTTRGQGSETELVKQIQHYFVDYKLRIYCCGGSGTLRNVVNGVEDFSRVEIGFYPCGLTNDFLKSFGQNQEKFNHIENLIDGISIPVDYIRTNRGIALNTFSVGMDSHMIRNTEKYRVLSGIGAGVPYFLSMLQTLVVYHPKEYEVSFDGETYRGKLTQVIFGNGGTIVGHLQFATDVDLTDGMGQYTLVRNVRGSRILPAIMAMFRKDMQSLEKVGDLGSAHAMTIRSVDGSPLEMDFDGELVYGTSDWTAEIIPKGLKFIVPKGVELHG